MCIRAIPLPKEGLDLRWISESLEVERLSGRYLLQNDPNLLAIKWVKLFELIETLLEQKNQISFGLVILKGSERAYDFSDRFVGMPFLDS